MGYPPIEELLPKSGFSIYKLVRMASDRAIELADGKKPMIPTTLTDKTATIALEEIRDAKVVLGDVAALFEPLQEEKAAAKVKEKGKEDQ